MRSESEVDVLCMYVRVRMLYVARHAQACTSTLLWRKNTKFTFIKTMQQNLSIFTQRVRIDRHHFPVLVSSNTLGTEVRSHRCLVGALGGMLCGGSTSVTVWRQRSKPEFENCAAKKVEKTTVSPSLIPVRYGAVKFLNAGTCSVAKTRGCAYARWSADSNNVFSNIDLPVVRILWLEHGMLVWQPAQLVVFLL